MKLKQIFLEVIKTVLFSCFLSALLADFAASQATQSRCTLLTDRGPCKAQHKMFAFDSFDEQCKEFQYSGCGGNPNRFSTYEECRNECQPINMTTLKIIVA